MQFKYRWWGKGDLDASIGIFFDGFSKILSATGITLLVFGMPADIVLGKIVPGVGLAKMCIRDSPGEEEPGAGDGAAGAQVVPGAVQVFRLPQKPQPVPRGDPVVPEVLAVAVAGDHPMPGGERLVHLRDEAGVQQVVCVKGEEPVVALAALVDLPQQEVEGVAPVSYTHLGTAAGDSRRRSPPVRWPPPWAALR